MCVSPSRVSRLPVSISQRHDKSIDFYCRIIAIPFGQGLTLQELKVYLEVSKYSFAGPKGNTLPRFTALRTPFTVPVQGTAQGPPGPAQPEQFYEVPDVDSDRPIDAWVVISVIQGTLEVHHGTGPERYPSLVTAGGMLKVHREQMSRFMLRCQGATAVLGEYMYTSDPNYSYRSQG